MVRRVSKDYHIIEFTDVRYPIQVKQRDKVGTPNIRDFEGVLAMHERTKGFYVAFDYSTGQFGGGKRIERAWLLSECAGRTHYA